jgi:hypothetical protein
MAKGTEKLYRTFVKGIVTEASPLTYPENASIDEDNFVLNRDGSRSRRLGVDYELDYALKATGLGSSTITTGKQSFHKWDSPGGDTSVSIGVIRVAERLWFIDLLTTNPSNNFLNGGTYITLSGLNKADIDTAVINNSLIVSSSDLDTPILLTYNVTTQTVSQTNINIKVRDIWGVADGLALDERPNSLSDTHKYNLRNQGWRPEITNENDTKDALPRLFAVKGYYPSNADIWSVGKVTDVTNSDYDKFNPNIFDRNSVYSGLAPKGSYIIDAFNRGNSRTSISDVTSGLVTDQETGNINTVASYAGRIFYSGVSSNVTDPDAKSPNYSGYIFFSQVITENSKLGFCYQDADPTDPDISDLIETDGGTIQIPECSRIVKLIPSRTSLLVFAENGVWEVFGDTNGFVATSFQVSKITTFGTSNAKSVVNIGGTFIYWAKAGIVALKQDDASGRYIAQNLSLTTIQSLYLNISELAKQNCKGFFDERENRARWLYNDTTTYSTETSINKYNRELIFDITLNSFYTNTLSSLTSNSPYVADYIDIPGYSVTSSDTEVVVASDSVIITDLTQVVINEDQVQSRTSQFSFLTITGTSFTLSKFRNTDFYDWKTAGSGTGVSYSSYLVTGYELFQDILREKTTPYVTFFFKRTEDGFEEDINNNLIYTNPSSCLVQAQWNWANSQASGKWGTQFQAYRLLRNYLPSSALDNFNYGESVIVTKNKLRGSGKCLSLKFTSEAGKDIRILGWGIVATALNQP